MWRVGGVSQVWKKILQARDEIEHQIEWNARRGDISFWHDNWTGLGDLYTIPRDVRIAYTLLFADSTL